MSLTIDSVIDEINTYITHLDGGDLYESRKIAILENLKKSIADANESDRLSALKYGALALAML